MTNTDHHSVEALLETNKHLPAQYQNDLEVEYQRFNKDTLSPQNLSERKILIVGGAGYVGTVLTDHFLSVGYKVRCFDNLLYKHGLSIVPTLHHKNYELLHGDITSNAEFELALNGVTDVILLAGLVGDPVTKKYPEISKKVNDEGYDLILRKINGRRFNKVVFVSTCSNYGLIEGDQIAAEDFPLKPLSLYAESKVRIEEKILNLKDDIDYHPTILRFATAFGLSPRMRFDLTVSEFTRTLALGEELLIYDADTWRPYCHLRDFAELIRRVLEAPVDRIAFEVFNAGGDVNNYTKKMIAEAILKEIPNGDIRYQKHDQDPRNYRVNFSKVRETLFFEPAYTVPDGIRELLTAMKQGLFKDISQPTSYYGNWEVSSKP